MGRHERKRKSPLLHDRTGQQDVLAAAPPAEETVAPVPDDSSQHDDPGATVPVLEQAPDREASG